MLYAREELHRNLIAQVENDTEDRVVGRAHMLLGLWAGALLGLPEERRVVYALEVMVAGMAEPGPDDIIDKMISDFAGRGVPTTRGEILIQLSKKHRLAAIHFGNTDYLRLVSGHHSVA